MYTLFLYEGKYGTTRLAAETSAALLSNAKCVPISDAPQELAPYGAVVFVFGFYGPDAARQIKAYILQNKEPLSQKKLAAVGVGLSKADFPAYRAAIEEAAGREMDFSGFIPGQLRLAALTEADRKAIEAFCGKVGMPLIDMGEYKPMDAIALAGQLADVINTPEKAMDAERLKTEIDRYISGHNTLALATAAGEAVRCTPLEYQYLHGCFFIITEGGTKLKGIFQNHNISMAIFDFYEGMNKLAGLQITGRAELVPMWSEAYCEVFKEKKLGLDALKRLPVDLHLVKIVPEKFEFLHSQFRKDGFDARQVYFVKQILVSPDE